MKTKNDSKTFKSHNKSGKPDNIVEKENDIYMECDQNGERNAGTEGKGYGKGCH